MSVSDPQLEPKPPTTSPEAPAAAFAGIHRLSQWLHGRLPQPAPPVYRRHYYLQIGLFLALMVVLQRLWQDDIYRLGVLTASLIYAIAAIGLYFSYSLAGLFAFSQGAFMGLGAYTSARVAEEHGFVLGFLAALVVTFIAAVALGLVLRKARHFYFAIGALAFAELFVLLFRNWGIFAGQNSGLLFGIPPPTIAGYTFATVPQMFWLVLVAICLVLVIASMVERSPVRRDALAAKQLPMAAHTTGVPVYKVAIFVFGFGSVLAGLAGSLEAHTLQSISPVAFGVGLAINLYLMILLGGIGSVWGAVVGALFVTWLPEVLRPIKEYQTVVFSLLLLATIIAFPDGIVGTLSKLSRKGMSRVTRR